MPSGDGSNPGRRPGGYQRRESLADARARRAAVDDPEVVLAAGLRFLEARSRSVEEVRRRLADAGYRPDLVAATLDRLAAIGLLDDELFARGWIESRDRARPRGETALRRELSQRGVGRTEISAALDERRDQAEERSRAGLESGDDGEYPASPDEAAARRLIERRQRDLDRIDDPRKRRERAYALLARNGFDPEVCRTVAASVAPPAGRP
ncbi:MAG TPA: regulatory protein RecX [Candidatus Limnocylindrales bacterium]|nr:regulatory protein RecX [Candidatus Limnocylindrales bacterium]